MVLIKRKRDGTEKKESATHTNAHSIKIFICAETIEWKACVGSERCGYHCALQLLFPPSLAACMRVSVQRAAVCVP